MLCKNWEDWILKNRQNLACKISLFILKIAYLAQFPTDFNNLDLKAKLGYALSKTKEILKIKQKPFFLPDDQEKYSCFIKREMHNKRGIFKNELCLDDQWANLIL